MKKILLLFFTVTIIGYSANCQNTTSTTNEGAWEAYLARYEEGVGSTTLNMDLIKVAPIKELPFLLVTGVTFKNCENDGLPNEEQLNNLYEISDHLAKVMADLTKSEYVGSFTLQCDRLEYFYISDTLGIRSKLVELYSTKYGDYKYYINLEKDENWEAYTAFLYPNEETQEYISNEKIIEHLEASGDDILQPRQVDHWMYFKDEPGRDRFEKFIIANGFKIENKSKQEEGSLPYMLHISRVDNVDIESITKLTLFLRQNVKRENGDYDGWETFIVKK